MLTPTYSNPFELVRRQFVAVLMDGELFDEETFGYTPAGLAKVSAFFARLQKGPHAREGLEELVLMASYLGDRGYDAAADQLMDLADTAQPQLGLPMNVSDFTPNRSPAV